MRGHPTDRAHVAPPELILKVRASMPVKGVRPHRVAATVVPYIQVNPHPNKHTPRGEPRWIARCPECPGCEVVGIDLFECGSCGAVAQVAWDEVSDG